MELLDELDELLGRLAEVDLSRSDDVVRLHRGLSRLDAVVTRSVASWDAADEWKADGARSAPAWIAGRCGTPLPSARRRVRLARASKHLPLATSAWLDGDIESAHVAALAAARNDRTADALARDEAILVDNARQTRFDRFHNSLAYWVQHADPDGCDDNAAKQRDDRRADLSQTFAGMWSVTCCSTRSPVPSWRRRCGSSITSCGKPTGARRRNASAATRCCTSS